MVGGKFNKPLNHLPDTLEVLCFCCMLHSTNYMEKFETIVPFECPNKYDISRLMHIKYLFVPNVDITTIDTNVKKVVKLESRKSVFVADISYNLNELLQNNPEPTIFTW